MIRMHQKCYDKKQKHVMMTNETENKEAETNQNGFDLNQASLQRFDSWGILDPVPHQTKRNLKITIGKGSNKFRRLWH